MLLVYTRITLFFFSWQHKILLNTVHSMTLFCFLKKNFQISLHGVMSRIIFELEQVSHNDIRGIQGAVLLDYLVCGLFFTRMLTKSKIRRYLYAGFFSSRERLSTARVQTVKDIRVHWGRHQWFQFIFMTFIFKFWRADRYVVCSEHRR